MNHRLSAIRPVLIDSAPQSELKGFQDLHERGHFTISVTQSWLQAVHAKLLTSCDCLPLPALKDPSPLPRTLQTLSRSQQMQVCVLTGIVDLIFNPPTPLAASSARSRTIHVSPPPVFVTLPGYPETLFLDISRLMLLTSDAADLTATYMLLMLYRQLVFTAPTPSPGAGAKPKIEDTEVDGLKREIWQVGPPRLGLCFYEGYSLNEDTKQAGEPANTPPPRDLKDRWRKGMRAAVLQVARRAEQTRAGIPFTPRTEGVDTDDTPDIVPNEQTIRLANGWAGTNMRSGSSLGGILRAKLRAAVLRVVVSAVMAPGVTPAGPEETRVPPGSGLEALSAEIQHFGLRVTKLAALHLSVYGEFYEQKGLLPC